MKSSLVLASGYPRGRNAHPSQAWLVVDGEEQVLCIGKDWCPTLVDSSQAEGARGYTPSL